MELELELDFFDNKEEPTNSSPSEKDPDKDNIKKKTQDQQKSSDKKS